MNVEQLQEWLSEIASLSSKEKAHGSSANLIGSKIPGSAPQGRDSPDGLAGSKSSPKPGKPSPEHRSPAAAILASLRENAQMVGELLNFIKENYEDEESFEPLCAQLLTIYQLGGPMRVFVLQFIPGLCWTYLEGISRRKRRSLLLLETLLVAIYSEEIIETNVSEPGKKSSSTPKIVSQKLSVGQTNKTPTTPTDLTIPHRKVEVVKIPTLSTPSIYHEPSNISHSILNDLSLNRLNPPSGSGTGEDPYLPLNSSLQIGPFPAVNEMNPENRFLILSRILKSYNKYLAQYHQVSLKTLCQCAAAIARSGFHYPESELVPKVLGSAITRTRGRKPRDYFQSMDDNSDKPRVQVNGIFLQELLNAIYFCLFNGLELVALRALDMIHQRAHFELLPDILLVTNAIINSLLENPSGTPQEGPMGIRISSSGYSFAEHSASSSSVSEVNRTNIPGSGRPNRRLVTNASLRIKKMPEDIPLKEPVDQAPSSPPSARKKALNVIVETANKAKEHLKQHIGDRDDSRDDENIRGDSNTSSPKIPRAGHDTVMEDEETERLMEKSEPKKSEKKFRNTLNLGPIKASKSEQTMEQINHEKGHKNQTSSFVGILTGSKKGKGTKTSPQMCSMAEQEEPIELDDIFVQPHRENTTPNRSEVTSSSSSSHTSIQTVIFNPVGGDRGRAKSMSSPESEAPVFKKFSAGQHDRKLVQSNSINGAKTTGKMSGSSSDDMHSYGSSRSGSYVTPRERTPDPDEPLLQEEDRVDRSQNATPRIALLNLGPKPPETPKRPTQDFLYRQKEEGSLENGNSSSMNAREILLMESTNGHSKSANALRHADSSDALSD